MTLPNRTQRKRPPTRSGLVCVFQFTGRSAAGLILRIRLCGQSAVAVDAVPMQKPNDEPAPVMLLHHLQALWLPEVQAFAVVEWAFGIIAWQGSHLHLASSFCLNDCATQTTDTSSSSVCFGILDAGIQSKSVPPYCAYRGVTRKFPPFCRIALYSETLNLVSL